MTNPTTPELACRSLRMDGIAKFDHGHVQDRRGGADEDDGEDQPHAAVTRWYADLGTCHEIGL